MQVERTDTLRPKTKLLINKFIYARPVTPEEFLGRDKEIRRFFSRLTTGQSIAIIGQPNIGKTSFLNYILDIIKRQNFCDKLFERDLFKYLDAQMLQDVDTPADFWEKALTPLNSKLQIDSECLDKLKSIYDFVKENKFGNFVLNQLFSELAKLKSRLILVLDEFDVFLSHPKLHSAEFYGGLRSLASCYRGLVLVIASRRNLQQLTEQTYTINPYGSPYFNVFSSLPLGAFSENEMTKLLDHVDDHFNKEDLHYIRKVSGKHPFLVQIAAAILWDIIEDGHSESDRYLIAGRELYKQTRSHFADTWHCWSNATRKAITAVALAQIPRKLGRHKLRGREFRENLIDYYQELEDLKTSGLVEQIDKHEWSITQDAFLWWLTDELLHAVRDESDFKTWLQNQKIDFLLTKSEQEKMGNAVKEVLSLAEKGVITLIEAFARGIGEGFGKELTK